MSAFCGITCSVLCWPCDLLGQWDVIEHAGKDPRPLCVPALLFLFLCLYHVTMSSCSFAWLRPGGQSWLIQVVLAEHTCDTGLQWHLQTRLQRPLRCEELHFTTLHLTDTCVIPAEFIWALLGFCKLLGTGYLSDNGRLLIDDVHVFGPVVFWIRAMHVFLKHLHLTAGTPWQVLSYQEDRCR